MTKKKAPKEYDVIIVGAGITGTSLAYTLSNYTNIKKIAIIEKYPKPAQVNSSRNNNSQTLHMGDIETNYTLEKAKKVKASSSRVAAYLDKHDRQEKFHHKKQKMVLAVGDEEIKQLEKRFEEFKELFPTSRLAGKEELKKIEPKIVEGREEKICAMYNPEGYIVDYGGLSASFLDKSKADKFFNTRVRSSRKTENGWTIRTNKGEFRGKAVLFCTGAHSLLYARDAGYAKDKIILPVLGTFYKSKEKLLNGKVYMMQLPHLPFAAVHGDPAFGHPSETRFGPIAKVLPILEIRNINSFLEFLHMFRFNPKAFWAMFRLLLDPIMFRYVFRQFSYEWPLIGKGLYAKHLKKIIPTIKSSDIEFGRDIGGVRPQILDINKKGMDFGSAKIVGDKIIFNITPSPGASSCLGNAEEDAEKTISFLGSKYKFNREKFLKEHKWKE